jgi:hypothetical protein
MKILLNKCFHRITINRNRILTKGCLVSQCLKTFNTRIVEAVLTIVYSFALCSLELDARGFPLVVDCGDAELPPNIMINRIIK